MENEALDFLKLSAIEQTFQLMYKKDISNIYF